MLSHASILLVEDDALVAEIVQVALEEAGWTVVGPYSTVSGALEAARQEDVDAAMLDVGLEGGNVFPVADQLARRDIPFMFVSGQEAEALPPEHAHRVQLRKPYQLGRLEALTRGLLSEAPARPGHPQGLA
jgi:DNA-binding response OmpR family regulator